MANSLKVSTTRPSSPTNSSISDGNANNYSQQYLPPSNSYSYYSGWSPYPPPYPYPPSQYPPTQYPPSQYPPSHLSSYLSSQISSHLPSSQFASSLDTASQTSQTSQPISLSNDNTEPSIKDFLELLDKKFGKERYTIYLQKFKEEEITVSQLAKMNSKVLLNEFGIEIIGYRLNLIKKAKNFL